jgi:hypothetical protein
MDSNDGLLTIDVPRYFRVGEQHHTVSLIALDLLVHSTKPEILSTSLEESSRQ